MYGIEVVELKNLREGNLRLSKLPNIPTFNIFVKGTLDDAIIHVILEAEGDNTFEIERELDKQKKNLKLYVNLITESQIDIVPGYDPQFYEEKTIDSENWKKTLEALQDTNISKLITNRYSQQDHLLQTGLTECFSEGDIFNGFPKLINWLDENSKKGASRFCSLRDACVHGITDVASKNLEKDFPGEFEFEDNVLIRDSSKNSNSIYKHLPEVLEQIKTVFRSRF